MRAEVHRAGRARVALGTVAGAVPPHQVVTRSQSASSICCGQMKWICMSKATGGEDLALAGDRLGAGTDDDVAVRLDVGMPALPLPAICRT